MTLTAESYVDGALALGWPDGEWKLKLPNAELHTIEVHSGVTRSLSLFVWNVLRPGDVIEIFPPDGNGLGVLLLGQQIRPTPIQKPERLPSNDAPDDTAEALVSAVRKAIDRLGLPVRFETVWAFLADGGLSLPPADVAQAIRETYHLDDDGIVRALDNEDLLGIDRPPEAQWDNIEQAFWEMNPCEEPPYLDRIHRKRKKSAFDGLEYHLDEMRHQLLTPDEEEALGEAIRRGQAAQTELRSGDLDHARKSELGLAIREADEARERFVRHNLRLVFSIASKYSRAVEGKALGLDDLVQAGYLGLLTAVERFDPTKGFKFSTYATWWIKQSISRHIAENSRTIRLPVHMHDKLATVRSYHDKLLAKLARTPSSDEIAEESGMQVQEVEAVLRVPETAHLSDEDSVDQLPSTLYDEAFELAAQAHLKSGLGNAMSGLTERILRVLTLRFGLDGRGKRTLEEIGQELGLTRERVRQLESKGLAILRSNPLVRALADNLQFSPDARRARFPKQLTEEQQAAWARVRAQAEVIRTIQGD